MKVRLGADFRSDGEKPEADQVERAERKIISSAHLNFTNHAQFSGGEDNR